MSSESLKKIIYNDLNQFLADLNRNFGIIQNSPLYRGFKGDDGNPGSGGSAGTRGTNFLFVYEDKFDTEFPGVGVENITVDWLNVTLNMFTERQKFLRVLNIDYLVNFDIIVLVDSVMLQYIELENIVINTGIAFNSEIALDTQLQKQINDYIKYYVANNETIKNLKTFLASYETYSKPYSSTDNTNLFDTPINTNAYIPYFEGVTSKDGLLLENFKHFGFSDTEFNETDAGTMIFGSVKLYCQLIQNTLNITNTETYNSTYVPGETNSASVVILQDTPNNGIMFGLKTKPNLVNFGSIYKDLENNLIIKSDMGNLATDYSMLIINKLQMKFNKLVLFEKSLTVGESLIFNSNISSKFLSSGEYIRDTTTYNTPESRGRILEIGYNNGVDNIASGSLNIFYANENIFSGYKNNVFVTDSDGKINKTYFRETSNLVNDISKDNLNNFVWESSNTNSANNFLTSNYFVNLINKVNAIQQHILEKYATKVDVTKEIKANNRLVYQQLNVATITPNVLYRKYTQGTNPSQILTARSGSFMNYLFDTDDININFPRELHKVLDKDFFNNLLTEKNINIFDVTKKYTLELSVIGGMDYNYSLIRSHEEFGLEQNEIFNNAPIPLIIKDYIPNNAKYYKKLEQSHIINIEGLVYDGSQIYQPNFGKYEKITNNFYTIPYFLLNSVQSVESLTEESFDVVVNFRLDSTNGLTCYCYIPSTKTLIDTLGFEIGESSNIYYLKIEKLKIYEIID